MKKFLPFLFILTLVVFFLIFTRQNTTKYPDNVAELGDLPSWEELSQISSEVDAEGFKTDLERYFTIGDTWKDYFSFPSADSIRVKTESGELDFILTDSVPGSGRYWRSKDELPSRSADKPLEGVRIALDPGHIGGKCAQMEERWFQIDDNLPVMEGEMVLLVAQHIKPQLEALGAEVFLTRKANEPVGKLRSPHFTAFAKAKVKALDLDENLTTKYADKLFYRTAEIRARAALVNNQIKPDMMVALHFNAEAWGNADDPELTDNNNFHILLNGAYTKGEVEHEDERFEMTRRILHGTIKEEILLVEKFVSAFKTETGLPAYQYEPNSKRAIKVDEEGYVWARNLLANRLYECPTIFLEPYIMNSHEVHSRVQLGDYPGLKLVNGKMKKSLFREYADAVVLALTNYYR